VTKKLPARPNLEHLRSQAKTLLARMRDGDDAAARVFMKHVPGAKGLTPAQVRAAGFRLADAQAAVAHKNGFAGWPGLARYVDRLRHLEGTWAFQRLEVDGEAMSTGASGDSHLLIDGDRFRMESPRASYEGIFDIDIERTPHAIDIDFVEGPEAGSRSEGIFELDGDRLTICLGFTGVARPTSFKTARGSGHALEHLVRANHARPAGVDGGTPPPKAPAPAKASAQAAAAFTDDVTPALKKLQGEWRPTELVTDGQALAPDMLAYGSRTFTGAETKVVFGGQTMLYAKVRINDATSPIEVDYLNLAGSKRGSISLGLMEWTGDEVAICMGAPGAARASDFTCVKGSGRTLSRWERKAQP
jgi:uncharacterized protein (TIGR03067 family)